MMDIKHNILYLMLLTVAVLSFSAHGLGIPEQNSGEFSPPLRGDKYTHLYWGDTHLHTSYSADAYLTSNTVVTPAFAYQFAQGKEVISSTGVRAKLRRPLDFLAIADHGEFLGVLPRLKAKDPLLDNWEIGERLSAMLKPGGNVLTLGEVMVSPAPQNKPPHKAAQSIWSEVVATADRYNTPGQFTAFAAYEWTSAINGNNLHRVVIYKDDGSKTSQLLPFTGLDSANPEDLWQALENYEQQTGGEILAIPHNGNVSNGMMFAPKTLDGAKFTAEYASTRARWEPLYEVTQAKGDSETHPSLSPTDEFADFERWDWSNLIESQPKQPWMLQYEYARSSLKNGLQHEAALGVNPFKFGLIGSSDIHTGLSTPDESNFFGKLSDSEPSPRRAEGSAGPWKNWRLGASGLAAVWAEENTREAIFAAFKRREVYGTTGSRIMVRFFGGWDFQPEDVYRPNYVSIGYKKGVPMGGDLQSLAVKNRAPVFMIVAAKDPNEAHLDRIQVIKGWLDAEGKTHEKIYDVALSDDRQVNVKTHKAEPVGNTVDVGNASYTNTIGSSQLETVWADPDFNPSERAFYYARVIEIPKPRWTAYDAKFYQLNLSDEIATVIQDRAYTSPIWYTP